MDIQALISNLNKVVNYELWLLSIILMHEHDDITDVFEHLLKDLLPLRCDKDDANDMGDDIEECPLCCMRWRIICRMRWNTSCPRLSALNSWRYQLQNKNCKQLQLSTETRVIATINVDHNYTCRVTADQSLPTFKHNCGSLYLLAPSIGKAFLSCLCCFRVVVIMEEVQQLVQMILAQLTKIDSMQIIKWTHPDTWVNMLLSRDTDPNFLKKQLAHYV